MLIGDRDVVTRAEMVKLLHRCGVLTLLEQGVEESFVDGSTDFPMSEMRMDSLSAMEFCIALEDRWGLSVSPDEINRLGTLGELVRILGGEDGR